MRNGAGRRQIRDSDPINFIRNPSVIPILPDDEATEDTVACIEYTYYKPRTLAFTDDDARLEWTQSSLSGGASVDFITRDHGLKIFVNGVVEGEVLLPGGGVHQVLRVVHYQGLVTRFAEEIFELCVSRSACEEHGGRCSPSELCRRHCETRAKFPVPAASVSM